MRSNHHPFHVGIVKISRARSYAGILLPDGLVRIHFQYGVMIYDPKIGEWYKLIKEKS